MDITKLYFCEHKSKTFNWKTLLIKHRMHSFEVLLRYESIYQGTFSVKMGPQSFRH